MKRPRIFAILFTIALLGYTAYVALDTFVIVRVIQEVPVNDKTAEEPASMSNEEPVWAPTESTEKPTQQPSTKAPTEYSYMDLTLIPNRSTERPTLHPTTEVPTIVTENSFSDKNIQITFEQIREYNTEIYIIDVRLSSAEYLKTAFAHDSYGKNVVNYTSAMAAEKQAILAVNGDYYGARERGYVARNGVLYRRSSAGSNQEDLVVYADGTMELVRESAITADELMERGARDVFSFGPALVWDEQITVGERQEVAIANARNQRTAIGYYEALHYVFVVSDGRTAESWGLSLYQLAELLQRLGVRHAYNLDGGGSSTLVFNGEIRNRPTGNGKWLYERQVSDIVYIGY